MTNLERTLVWTAAIFGLRRDSQARGCDELHELWGAIYELSDLLGHPPHPMTAPWVLGKGAR